MKNLMTKILINRITILVVVLISSLVAQAQEQLYKLNGNPRLYNYDDYARSMSYGSRAIDDTLELPFFDDFSEPFSRKRNLGDDYPNPDLWIGNTVYVNNHMAINPISQGVATFDGLNHRGRAYQFGSGNPILSDSLISKPIYLANAEDTVYLTFYYQAQGVGDVPEEEKVLQLDFRKQDSSWVNVWEVDGYFLIDNRFRLGQIAITDTAYLYDGFQFRFRNYTAEGGATDHWHLDYIYLDEGRTAADTSIVDVAYLGQTNVDYTGFVMNTTSSVLKEFNNMPWDHYKQNPEEFTGDTTYFAIRNNLDTISGSGDYSFKVVDAFNNTIFTSTVASPQIRANVICGNEQNNCAEFVILEPGTPNADTVSSHHDTRFGIDLPTNNELSSDSMSFLIVHNIEGLNDSVSANDTWAYEQLFYNYYAYDDGTAEVAYGLSELEVEGSVAVRYNLKKSDTLQAVQIYLNPTQFDLTNAAVDLAVWTGGNEPETLEWKTDSPINFEYTNHVNYFYHYFLDTALFFNAGTNVWVGWIQQPQSDLAFSVGLDRRSDRSENTFFRLSNSWNQSSIPGCVMVRPVFGQEYTWVGVDEVNQGTGLKVYPNPTTGQLYIQEQFNGQFSKAELNLFDLTGKRILSQQGYKSSLDLNGIQPGVYLLSVATEKSVFTERIVLQ